MHIGFGPWDVAVDGLGVAGVGLGPCGLGGGAMDSGFRVYRV